MQTQYHTRAQSIWLRAVHGSQAPAFLFAVATIAIVGSGRAPELARQLLDPRGVGLGLGLGLLMFLSTMTMLNGPRRGLEALRLALGELREVGPRRSLILLARAGCEEAFWRGTLQVLLGPVVVGVSCVAGAFTARHVYVEAINHRSRDWARIVEFLVFSLTLGLTYALTERLVVVIMIHWTRNLLLQALVSPSHFPKT